MAQVFLNDVTKIYPGGVEAVKRMDLDIQDKEFIGFVGPSGCGKTTTLRMIAGLEEITDGKIDVYMKTPNHEYIVSRIDARLGIKEGEELPMHIDISRVHVFVHGETGDNVPLEKKHD